MFQEVQIIGNLGTDPELRFTPQGDGVCNFSVATNRKWTGKDGQPAEETIWFRISAWAKLAESCNQYLLKGSKVFVKGSLQADSATGGPRIWNDQEGNPRASFEIRARNVLFLSPKQESQSSSQLGNGQPDMVVEDEIPF